MNLQIVSNSVNNVGTINYINDFTMALKEPIDAENRENITKNIFKNDCFFSLEMEFINFKPYYQINAYYQDIEQCAVFKTNTTYLPNGIYSTALIIDFVNQYLQEYDVVLEKSIYGKIAIHFYIYYEHWFKKFKSKVTQANMEKKAFNGGKLNVFQRGDECRSYYNDAIISRNVNKMKITLHLSDKLKFILGFNDNAISETYDGNSSILKTIYAENLPDPSDGVNKIFIYCDQVEKSVVGDSESELLAIVPLQIKDKDLANYLHIHHPLLKGN